MSYFQRIVIFLLCNLLLQITAEVSWASDAKPFLDSIHSTWAGQVRIAGKISWPDDESIFNFEESHLYKDGYANLRLMNKTSFSEATYLETHYELAYYGGDTIQAKKALQERYPDFVDKGLLTDGILNDKNQFFDLTKNLHEGDDDILYHRLDRLFLAVHSEWGAVRIGRQALTWGNGMVFNPMDLFHPFAPTDFIRDYKFGEDMITIQVPLKTMGDLQLVYVPRRNPVNGNVEFDESSLASKLHIAAGTMEFDIMAASHYKDEVIGFGCAGFLRDAVWRIDATYTFLDDSSNGKGFLSVDANMDTSWIWGSKNFYGLIEFYFNGLGTDSYSEALSDPDIIARLVRGDMFTVGRLYLSGIIEMELHPLLKVYLTMIHNLADPSGIFQPRAVWDFLENFQLTFAANISYGGIETEFGGFKAPEIDQVIKSPDNVSMWLTYYF